MRIKVILTCIWMMLASTSVYSQSSSWRGIVPGVSTRIDVERVVGKPAETCRLVMCRYETEGEVVHITYSRGPCLEDEPSPFDFPLGTVLEVSVVPGHPVPLSESHLDLTKYVKAQDREVNEIFWYSDSTEGIVLEVQKEKIESFTYSLGPKFEYRRCAGFPKRAFTNHGQPCPTVTIQGRTTVRTGAKITIHALAKGLDPTLIPIYKWTVSAGTIVSGQDSSSITLNTAGLGSQTITVTVEVVGFPSECPAPTPFKISLSNQDSPRGNNNDLKSAHF